MKLTKLLCLYGATYLLYACGATTEPSVDAKQNKATVIEQIGAESDKNELEQIARDYARNRNVTQRNTALLQLADKHIQSQDCVSANIIIKHTQPTIQDTSHVAYANLLKSECVLLQINQLNDFENKAPYLALIEKWVDDAQNKASPNIGTLLQGKYSWNTRLAAVQAQYFALQEDYKSALNTIMMQSNSETFLADDNYKDAIWNWYSLLNTESRQQLTNRFPALETHKLLFDIIEDESISDSVRQANLQQWLVNNANSPIAQHVPLQLSDYLSLNNFEEQNIAVLLPLSGRLSSQGEAIKQGILAAYYQRLNDAKLANAKYKVSLAFIDTGSFSELSSDVTQESLAKYDTLVGPLLRSHIEPIKQLALPNTKQLVLNFLPNSGQEFAKQRAMFSLSPEQEAQQLVSLMRSQDITNPVLIVDDANITERMRDAFIEAWRDSEPKDAQVTRIQEIKFTDNKSMRIGITSALDVLQSQKRIKQISNLTDERVISVTRNRRDVDAFVVFARPDDVELINPIIESSISLFSDEQTPVFATSYSYDHKQNKNTQRDLRNLVFTDMPWVLPEGRNSELSKTVDSLFNQPSSSFLRLFAFGYDSLSLVDNLAKLSTFSHMSVKGLSGEISIDESQLVTRKLPFLVINDEAAGD